MRRQRHATSSISEAFGAADAPFERPTESGVAEAPVEAARAMPAARTADRTILRMFQFPPVCRGALTQTPVRCPRRCRRDENPAAGLRQKPAAILTRNAWRRDYQRR